MPQKTNRISRISDLIKVTYRK